MEASLHWIPLFPLMGAIFNLLFGKLIRHWLGDRIGKELVHLVAIGAVAFSCFYTFSLVWEQMMHGPMVETIDLSSNVVFSWISVDTVQIDFALRLDRLSSVMCMVVTGVGLLIHIFSVGYMSDEELYHRYFAYLNLFMGAMLILVMAKSLALLFVGWEGVGVCSYLLIGFWFSDSDKASAGRKAFIVNRIGDFGVILAMLLIFSVVGSLDFERIRDVCISGEASPFVTGAVFGLPVATVVTLLLFLGCTGKSAQIPLYVWLPDAMAGPTPVSALIHAATMVTAGVYLIVRMNWLFALAPVTMAIIALIGACTALFAATIAVTQNDIKKVLAYSTVSQLGYMFLAVGMGAWVSAIFHLVTHAFFKACLFLGSGSVIHACHHEQDIRVMGNLKQKMPITRWTFLASCLAIAGIPPFAGFFSKDEIMLHAYVNHSAWGPGFNYLLYSLALIAAAFTAFYMFRLYFLTFEGSYRGDHHTWEHIHEERIMNGPLVVLGLLAVLGGFLGYPHVFPMADPGSTPAEIERRREDAVEAVSVMLQASSEQPNFEAIVANPIQAKELEKVWPAGVASLQERFAGSSRLQDALHQRDANVLIKELAKHPEAKGRWIPHLLHDWLHPIVMYSDAYHGPYYVGLREGWFAEPAHGEHGHPHLRAVAEYAFIAISVGVAGLAVLLAYMLFITGPSPVTARWIQQPGIRGLYRASYGKYFIDEFYLFFVAALNAISRFCYQVIDRLLVDGVGVHGSTGAVAVLGDGVRRLHNGNVRRYLLAFVVGLVVLLASVYANPIIAQFGPSNVNPDGVGGLREKRGPHRIRVQLFNLPPFEIGPEEPNGGPR